MITFSEFHQSLLSVSYYLPAVQINEHTDMDKKQSLFHLRLWVTINIRRVKNIKQMFILGLDESLKLLGLQGEKTDEQFCNRWV